MCQRLAVLSLFACCLPGWAFPAEAVDALVGEGLPDAQQPQVAVSPSGKVYLAFGAGNAVYCTTSEDGGKSYASPVKVGEAGALTLGVRRGPRVAATDRTVIITAVGGKVGHGRDGDVLAWRSDDGGRSWKGPVRVNGVPGSAREGLHHTAAAPDGTVYCVWLDLRARKMQVYGAASADGGETWHGERLIYASPDGSVCECCQPQVAYDPRGTLLVMWRNQLGGARDMYLLRSTDHGKTLGRPVKLGRETWPLNACPMDGGGLAGAADGEVVTVWRRKDEVFRCTPGSPEVRLGRGEQPWAAAGPGGFYLVWLTGQPGAVMALLPGSDRPTRLAEKGSDPVVAAPPGGGGPVVAAWEEGPPSHKRIRASVLAPGR
jgi:hypothetical protein